jgi:hypothetical protein
LTALFRPCRTNRRSDFLILLVFVRLSATVKVYAGVFAIDIE